MSQIRGFISLSLDWPRDRSLEARGVDVHVFFQSLEALHENYRALKKAFLAGYGKKGQDGEQVISKVEEIKGRGRYL